MDYAVHVAWTAACLSSPCCNVLRHQCGDQSVCCSLLLPERLYQWSSAHCMQEFCLGTGYGVRSAQARQVLRCKDRQTASTVVLACLCVWVNCSHHLDLASMGYEPCWLCHALLLPSSCSFFARALRLPPGYIHGQYVLSCCGLILQCC